MAVCSTLTAQEEPEKKEEIKSLSEERLETLQFGIDSEITTLIDALEKEKNEEFFDELVKILSSSNNNDLKSRILTYFKGASFGGAQEAALPILENWEDENQDLLIAVVNYFSDFRNDTADEIIFQLISSDDTAVASSALRAAGKSGRTDFESTLRTLYEDPDFSENLKPNIILALGDLKSYDSVPFLSAIAEDDDQESIIRRYACDSLRKIGDPAAIGSIEKAYATDDVILRSYAMYAMSGFKDADVVPFLIEGLKDSYVKVRISAAQGLGDLQAKEAIPILQYKARKDPEQSVRIESVKALGLIGTKDSYNFLRELFSDRKVPLSLRRESLHRLVVNDLDSSISVIKGVIEEEWGAPRSPLLESIGLELSTAESGKLESIFARFLDHSSITMKLYGLRGLEKNGVGSQKERVEQLTEEGNHMQIRKTALSIMEGSR